MFGFSVFLHQDLDLNQIEKMAKAGFSGVFTSLNIPEDDSSNLLFRLDELSQVCENLNLTLTVDVSSFTLDRLKINPLSMYQMNITQFRLDSGIKMKNIARLSHVVDLALNASTIKESDFDILNLEGANFDRIEAWHNYYPRKNTGLAEQWFNERNIWLKEHEVKVAAFVPGDGNLRPPIFASLPTLEKDRFKRPLAPAMHMLNTGMDKVCVGDESLSSDSIEQFKAYIENQEIILHARCIEKVPDYFDQTLHQRPDIASGVVRIAEGRQLKTGTIKPQATPKVRTRGSITIDNSNAMRYEGELQIVKRDLPADPTVNVIGHINEEDLDLLDHCKPEQAIKIKIGN